jgi:hypothetical protein
MVLGNTNITKLEALLMEVIKNTWQEGRVNDTKQEKLRKLNEKNYNTRILYHLRQAITLASFTH